MNNWYDILSVSQVTDRLFVGGQARAADLAKSNPYRISAVLCVHQTMDYPKNPDIVYMHIPFDDGKGIPYNAFVQCLAWLKFMYENGHTILIHCAAGISRSVTILASFMHHEDIAELHEALDQIRIVRKNANPAPDTFNSAKRMLRIYPYDGTYEEGPEKAAKHDLIEQVQNKRAAYQHPDEACPMRLFLLSGAESNVPRHEIPCSCEQLQTPLDIAKQKDGIEPPAESIEYGKVDG